MSRTPKICKSQQVTKVPAIVSLARKSAKQSKPWNILEPFDKSFGAPFGTQNLGGFGAVNPRCLTGLGYKCAAAQSAFWAGQMLGPTSASSIRGFLWSNHKLGSGGFIKIASEESASERCPLQLFQF